MVRQRLPQWWPQEYASRHGISARQSAIYSCRNRSGKPLDHSADAGRGTRGGAELIALPECATRITADRKALMAEAETEAEAAVSPALPMLLFSMAAGC